MKLPVTVRRGGFGGAEGLARFLAEERIDRVIDATHPFAVQMKAHAIAAAQEAGVPLLAVRRAPWVAEPGDEWIVVGSLDEAAAALGASAEARVPDHGARRARVPSSRRRSISI